MGENFSFLLITVILSINENQTSAIESICNCIIQQQVDLLAKINAVGAIAQEQQEEDWRAMGEDTVCVMEAKKVAWAVDAKATRKATKKAK